MVLIPRMFRFAILRALICIALLFIVIEFSPAQAGSPRVVPGVNRPGIAWITPDAAWQHTVDAMSRNGIKSLRMMLVTPYEKSLRVISYCNNKEIDVLLMVPLTLDEYYATPVHRRKGNKNLYTVPGLSALQIEKFRAKWGIFIQALSTRNLRIRAVQIDNEFNSAAFNGDLPLVKGGAVLTLHTYREFAFWDDYYAGMQKLLQIVRIVSTSLKENKRFQSVPVILGGLARPTTTWLRNVDGALVEPDLALKVLIDLGVDHFVDGYAIHVYPQVPRDQWAKPETAILKYLDARLAEVIAISGTKKAWWITEWGFARQAEDRDTCDGEDTRMPLFKAFLEAISRSRWASLLGPTYIYDWDESRRFRIYYHDAVLCSQTHFFKNPS
jgi:hypothetical protein